MLISISAEYLVSLGYPHRSKQLTSLKDSLSSVLNHQLKIWTVISTTRSLHRIYLPHCSSIMGNIFIQHALVPPTFHFLVFLVAGIKLSWNKTFHISLWMRWSTEFYQLFIRILSERAGFFSRIKESFPVSTSVFENVITTHILLLIPLQVSNCNTCDPPKSAWQAAPFSNSVAWHYTGFPCLKLTWHILKATAYKIADCR